MNDLLNNLQNWELVWPLCAPTSNIIRLLLMPASKSTDERLFISKHEEIMFFILLNGLAFIWNL